MMQQQQQQLNSKKIKNTAAPLAPSTVGNTIDLCEDKENMEGVSKTSGQSWLSKVCNKLRHKQRRPEKCEKCGQRSDTCRANASFISGRKHYLCEDCRVSSDNMKSMYHQLCRNLSLRDPPRPTTASGGGDLSPPASSSSRGVVRSRSMRARPTAPESGYDTATSLDSSCSNGRLSPDPVYLSSGECAPLPADSHHPASMDPWTRQCRLDFCGACAGPSEDSGCSDPHHHPACSKDKSEVFGGAFKSEKAHFRDLHTRPKTKVYTRQQRTAATPTSPPQPPRQPHYQKQPLHKDTAKYDGYLEIRTPNSQSVKYVFKQRENNGEEAQDDKQLSRRRYSENLKQCYRCQKFHCVAFRAPFGNGWLCEDCMDDLM